MDPLSITVGCVSLLNGICKTSIAISGFVRDFRAARHDLDAVSRELASLESIIKLLQVDCDTTEKSETGIPETLQTQVKSIIEQCVQILGDLQALLEKHVSAKLGKSTMWVTSGKGDVAKLKATLEAHRGALNLALDLVAVSISREIKTDTKNIIQETKEIHKDTSALKEDTTQILEQIAQLREQLPAGALLEDDRGFMLNRYLDALTSYADTVVGDLSDHSDNGDILGGTERSKSPDLRRLSTGEKDGPYDADSLPNNLTQSTVSRDKGRPQILSYKNVASYGTPDATSALPDNFNPSIRGTVVHDFSAPGENVTTSSSGEKYDYPPETKFPKPEQMGVLPESVWGRLGQVAITPSPISKEERDVPVIKRELLIGTGSPPPRKFGARGVTRGARWHPPEEPDKEEKGSLIGIKRMLKDITVGRQAKPARTGNDVNPHGVAEPPKPNRTDGWPTEDAAFFLDQPNFGDTDIWSCEEIQPEQVQNLIHDCTQMIKLRALDIPFFFLPFRDFSNPNSADEYSQRSIRQYFRMRLFGFTHELAFARLELYKCEQFLQSNILSIIVRWCWARLPGGVVSWKTHRRFREAKSAQMISTNEAINFPAFLAGAETPARSNIILDFFDLLASIASHSKKNGLEGRNLCQYAGWWAFTQQTTKMGLTDRYADWWGAALVLSHLFCAYLRYVPLGPEHATRYTADQMSHFRSLISIMEAQQKLPNIYTPASRFLVYANTDSESGYPLALLHKTVRNNVYDGDDQALRLLFGDPETYLNEECCRVLKRILPNGWSSSSWNPGDKDFVILRSDISPVPFEMDDTFWWVWMTSFGYEEPARRRATFSKTALLQLKSQSDEEQQWVLIEERAPETVAKKKNLLSFLRGA